MTPFDDSRLLWYVTPGTVSEASAEAMVATIRQRAPSVTGVLIKAWNGQWWPYKARAGRPRAIAGQADLRYWVELLHNAGLEAHAWGVARGQDVARESAILRQVADCGVDSLVVDVESGPYYFVGTAADATTLAKAAAATGVHVGLCFDYRGMHMVYSQAIRWLPYVGSLHPMCYHFHFERPAQSVLTEMAARLAPFGLPIVPALQGYSVGDRRYPPTDIAPTARIALQQPGVIGLSWFRYGNGLVNREDGMGPGEIGQLEAVRPATQTPAEPVLFAFDDRTGKRVDVLEVKGGRWRLPGAAGWMDAVKLRAA